MYNSTASLTSLLDVGGWSTPCPRTLYFCERACTHCIVGQWINRAGLDGCGISRPTGIQSLNLPARSGHMTAYLTELVGEFMFHSSSAGRTISEY
jgi:hypothetical protein